MEKREVMTVTTIDLFNILKERIGESDAKALVEFVEVKVNQTIEEKKDTLSTKADFHQLGN